MYADLGSEVTLVEMAGDILPVEDQAISRYAAQRFRERGIDVRTGTSVEDFVMADAGVSCAIGDGESKEDKTFDYVIVAVGVQANVEDIGLESIGAKVEHGSIAIDRFCRTNVTGVYAIGDAAGGAQFTHLAGYHGATIIRPMLFGLPAKARTDDQRQNAARQAQLGEDDRRIGHRLAPGHDPYAAS